MTLTMQQEIKISNEDIKEAIALLCSPVFGALNIANAVAGYQSVSWRLIRETKPLSKIFREALDRNIDLSTLQCAVEGGPVTERLTFKELMKSASEAEE